MEHMTIVQWGRRGNTYIHGIPVICTVSWWGAAGYSNCPKEFRGQEVTSEQVTLNTLLGSIHLTTKITSKAGATLYEVDDQTIIDRWWLYSKGDAWVTGIMLGIFAYVVIALWNQRKSATSALNGSGDSAAAL